MIQLVCDRCKKTEALSLEGACNAYADELNELCKACSEEWEEVAGVLRRELNAYCARVREDARSDFMKK